MISSFRLRLALIFSAAVASCGAYQGAAADDTLTAAEEAEVDSLVLTPPAPWSGDFIGMRERGLVRILVPYNKTHYFVDSGRQYGIAYELGVGLEAALNKKYPKQKLPFRVMFLPTPRDQIFDHLAQGKGDIAIAGLTITPERQKIVDFSIPFASGINEIVILGSRAPNVATLDDLSGHEITVRTSSSYYEHLRELNEKIRAAGRAEMILVPADDDLEDEDLLEMANAGLIDFLVVDQYLADLWSQVFSDIKPRPDLAIRRGGDIAFAIRKTASGLKQEIDPFVKANKIGTTVGNILIKRYVASTNFIKNVASEEDLARYAEIIDFFDKYGASYNFDPLMITAQGYQESGLKQSLRSPRGAVGIMQLLPSTAADPAVAIADIETDAERNIQAGTKYLRWLIDTYLDRPGLDQKNQTLMAFAAYNAGPGNLRKMRRLAEKSGLDPNQWFLNVEIGAARLVGGETVQYVGNIYKYYVAYKKIREREVAREKITREAVQ